MAKTNKFTSINFNHIYEKTLSTNSKPKPNDHKNPSSSSSSSSPSFSYSSISAPHTKTHGRMLVLTRPTPKPISTPRLLSPQPQQTQQPPVQTRSDPPPDAISLRPLGRTGSSPPVLSPVPGHARDRETTGITSALKPDKFVPPHLRPGFVRSRPVQTPFGHPRWYGDDGRPNSGGGNERMMKGSAESDFGIVKWPR